MAICAWCEREMTTAESCSVKAYDRDEVAYPIPVWGAERGVARGRRIGRCGDCNVAPGRHHHPGCDLAECPICRGQLLTCGCFADDEWLDEADEGGAGDERATRSG